MLLPRDVLLESVYLLVKYFCSVHGTDHKDPEPVHPGGRLRRASPSVLHSEDPGQAARAQPGDTAGVRQHPPDGHQICLPHPLPLQPFQNPTRRCHHSRCSQPLRAKEDLSGEKKKKGKLSTHYLLFL